MATVTDIADAVVTALAAGDFSQSFTPVRRVLPLFELTDLSDLQVTVVPKAVGIMALSRSESQFDFEVDIGVQKKLGSDLDTEVASLLDLVEEIVDYMRQRSLTAAAYVKWVQTANDPVYAPGHLLEKRTFTSIVTLTYRALGA